MLYLFDQDDKFITILSRETGLVDTWLKDYQNHIVDEPFIFNVDSNSELLQHIKEENQVAFYDRDGDLRLVRIKELYEVSTKDGHNIRVKCEPSFLELYDHFIEDKRITNGTAQTALNQALEGSRYVGEVTVELGLATDNFYWIDGIEAVFKILETWGGALVDTITLDEGNEIIERKIWIVQRLGTDSGHIIEPDYNAEQINRKTLSYIETALWGQGASLETDGGGYTRYITFEDVVWKVSAGDPIDKPLGQKWVGDPQALNEHGYLHNGVRKHRYGHFSNQDYETPEELLWATWQELQERKIKEIIHEATINEADKKVSLGDTVTILNRKYNKPIELQSQITGLEYDIFDDKEVTIIIGKYIDMNEDHLQKEVEDLKKQVRKPRPTAPINNGSFPDVKPGIPTNVTATGSFQTIQLFWDYDSRVYVNNYEVYGSRVSDFVPDEQHLLYRGRVSGFSHEIKTDEMWYYYVRAINTHGTASDYSVQVSASTVRIITDDILFGSITADLLADLSVDARNLVDNAVTAEKIANLAVGTAAIQNAAITNLKIGTGAVDTLQVRDGAITNAKIANLNADKINAGAIRGIDIYGAQFRSSDGNTMLDITGGNIRLRQSNGNYVHLSPDGLYGYNSSGSVRFQADSTFVTSSALRTSFSSVYLGALGGHEARVVDYRDIPSDGAVESYRYLPLRASGVYGNFLEANYGMIGETHVYLRPRSGGEIRVTAGQTTDTYLDLRSRGIYSTFVELNGAHGTGDHLYLRPRSAGEVRVTAAGSTTSYRDLRANNLRAQNVVYANNFENTARIVIRAASGDIFLQSNSEVRATTTGSTSSYIPVRASSFPTGSLAEYKQDIEVWDVDILDVYRNEITIYEYNLKSEANRRRQGLVIGEGYKTPLGLIDGDGTEQYLMNSWNMKAIQEVIKVQDDIKDDVNLLKIDNQYLKQKIKQLEEMVA